jgi:GTP-binding protein YchF
MKRVGILGLPRSGKTTLFEIVMQGAGTAPAAGHGREQVGVVKVPDAVVDRLSALYSPKKTTYAQIQFVDTAGTGAASARTAAKGPDLFSAVRTADALLAVVRDFESPSEAAPPDPARDLRTLETELALNDLAIVENRAAKLAKEIKVGRKEGEREHALLERCRVALEAERPLRAETFAEDELKILRGFQLLSLKPLIVVHNQADSGGHAPGAPGPHALGVALRAHLEREIVSLPPAERAAFRDELGVREDGLSLVIRACYDLLGLISFYTVGPDEVRAWTITRGETAVDAAGEIHTDLARGFIRAEVIAVDRLLEAGDHAQARERGWLRLEGREYVVQNGDCLEIRFNR